MYGGYKLSITGVPIYACQLNMSCGLNLFS